MVARFMLHPSGMPYALHSYFTNFLSLRDIEFNLLNFISLASLYLFPFHILFQFAMILTGFATNIYHFIQ